MAIRVEDMAPAVRARFLEISDQEFDQHPLVIQARESLASADKEHQACVQRYQAVKDAHEALNQKKDSALAEIQRLEQSRGALLADAFLQDGELSGDREILAQIVEFQHLAGAIDLAGPHIEAKARALSREIGVAVDRRNPCDEHLRNVLDELKRDEATRRTFS